MKKIVPQDAILIPGTAEEVFKGQIFSTYQWPQTMFDGSVTTFEMLKRPDTVEVLVVDGDNVLVIEDEQPTRGVRLTIPGGRVDPGETWDEAIKRELQEEAGLQCASWKLIDVAQPQTKIEWFTATYIAYDVTVRAEPKPGPGERIKAIWRPYADLRQDVLDGLYSKLDYLASIFRTAPTTDALRSLPSFVGKEVDRD